MVVVNEVVGVVVSTDIVVVGTILEVSHVSLSPGTQFLTEGSKIWFLPQGIKVPCPKMHKMNPSHLVGSGLTPPQTSLQMSCLNFVSDVETNKIQRKNAKIKLIRKITC